jgi:RNA polymerase sigma-70 factor (ECF subfamily)
MIHGSTDAPVSLRGKEFAAMRDAELVRAAQAGSHTAFAELQTLYSRHLYRTIFRITRHREDAEDALQDTFLRAYLALNAFQGKSTFLSWLTRIAINSALMVLRKRRARSANLFEVPIEPKDEVPSLEIRDTCLNPEQTYDQLQRCIRMLRAIERLNPKLRGPLEIRMEHGCSLEEIARTLGITVASVKTRLHRARARLNRAHVTGSRGSGRYAHSSSNRQDLKANTMNRELPCLNCN